MLFKSHSPDINLPHNQTLWSWLFETCLPKFRPEELQGFTDIATKQHLSYQDIKKYAEYFSNILSNKYNIRQGNVIVIYSKNSIWYPVIALASIRIGAIACGISPEYTRDELAYALRLTKAKLLFTANDVLIKACEGAACTGLSNNCVMLMDGAKDGLTSVKELLSDVAIMDKTIQVQQFEIPKDKSNHDVCAYLCLSSGTTGLPKAVMISHANIIAQCLQVQQITPPDHNKVLAALPFYHITGIVHELHLPIVLNAHVYVLPTYTLDSLLQTVSEYKIKELLIVPPILIRLVQDTKIVSRYDLSHVTRFSSGAAPLPKEILTLLETKFPNTGFKQGYGMTESCSAITSHPPSKYAYKYADKVGMVVGSTEVRIVDLNSGEDCGIGVSGEIWARDPQVAMGYLENPTATAETFDSNGFLHTGDIGEFDADGLLSITDRMKEMIKVKGIGVAPAELENLLLGHPLVRDVAVCGIPDDRAGERPKAFVVLGSLHNISPAEAGMALMEFTKTKKARHKWIAELEIVQEIPKSPAGKILRRKLKERPTGGGSNVTIRAEPVRTKL